MPTPMSQVITPIDYSPHEVESHEELRLHLDRGTLAALTLQGLDVTGVEFAEIEVAGSLFVGCTMSPDQVLDLIKRGAHVVPAFPDRPFPTQPSQLYTPEELAAGFDTGGFDAMYDTVVYRHYRERGGATPDLREALAQRIHDHGIDNAIAGDTAGWIAQHGEVSIVGIMGGHAELRGTPGYREAAALAWKLADAGRLVLTGGGPGVMEAANLGAYMASRPVTELSAAIDELAQAPDFRKAQEYTAAALAVRARHRPESAVGWAGSGGLSIPTWFFGHEPANLFAGRVGKLFSNAAREELILKLARGGIVFAPGKAGTVQEVFQATTMTFYGTVNQSGPFIFLGTRFWTEELPVRSLLGPLLAASPVGDLSGLIHVTDDVDEAAALLIRE